MVKKRNAFAPLLKRLKEPRRFIQSLIGPRQVGKTTLAKQAAEELGKPFHYASADLALLQDVNWLRQQWETARELAKSPKGALLIIDEVQKIPHWSDMVKFLWDQDSQAQFNLKVLLLGSSSWLMHKGLTESLAGRFEVMPITHWSFAEMHRSFDWNLDQYLFFGGYPGAAPLADPDDSTRWVNYINDSIIETTLSRDVLLLNQVNKPVLLRRLFQLGCHYSGQILSYTKMLGTLQDAGNSTTLAHYLELLAGAGLLTSLQKFANQLLRRRGSSPKFAVFDTALLSAQSGKNYQEARKDPVFWGRLVESAVGAHLLNSCRGTSIEVFYWREGDKEVDFVLKSGDKVIALEVKSSSGALSHSGIDQFVKQFSPDRVLMVGGQGISLEKFLTGHPQELFN